MYTEIVSRDLPMIAQYGFDGMVTLRTDVQRVVGPGITDWQYMRQLGEPQLIDHPGWREYRYTSVSARHERLDDVFVPSE